MTVKPPLVLVEWEDSSQPISRWQFSDDVDAATVRIASVGWLIKSDTSVVALAPNVGGLDGEVAGQCSGVIAIPARAVLGITPLAEAANRASGAGQMPRGHTIQSCLLAVLATAFDGMHISGLVKAVQPLYGRRVSRVSISPQLSRLKCQGLVRYNGGLWFPASADRSPKGQDAEERLDRNDESAVRESGDAQPPVGTSS